MGIAKKKNNKKSPPLFLILLLSLFILWCGLYLIKSIPKKIPPAKIPKPKIAIIIDDFGYSKRAAQEIYKIPSPITKGMFSYVKEEQSTWTG